MSPGHFLKKIRSALPSFYAHLVPMLIVLAVLKFLILTRFLSDPATGLFHPVTGIQKIILGIFLETLPVMAMVTLLYLLSRLGKLRKTLLSLQSVLIALDIAGLYFFTVYREWFRFEDFHLLQGASLSSAGDLISAMVPVMLVVFQMIAGIIGFLFLYKKLQPVITRKFAPEYSRRSKTKQVINIYLLITVLFGTLPLSGRVSTYGNTPVTRLVGSILQKQFSGSRYSLETGPDAFNYNWIRSLLYRSRDYHFPDSKIPFVRLAKRTDRIHPGVMYRPGRYNVVLFILESLSKHVVGSRHKGKAIAPSLTALQQRGLSFSRFYNNGFPSARAHEAIYFSLYPPMIEGYNIADHHEISFVQIMKKNGYHTGCFAAPFYRPIQAGAFFKRCGHDFYRYPAQYGIRKKERIAAETKMLEKMFRHIVSLNQRKPFMMTFLSEIGHIPYWYYPFDSRIKMLFPHDKQLETRYATQMHFIGELIARFIRKAERHPAFRNTIFIITGDHRPHKTLDYGAFGRKIQKKDLWHQKPLVPLIIYAPGIINKNRRVEKRPGGQIDIGPTILQMTGLHQGTHRGFGQSLIRRNFNYNRFLMLPGCDAVYDNRLINERKKTVQRLPVPAGSWQTERIPDASLFENYRKAADCLRKYRQYYQQAARFKPLI